MGRKPLQLEGQKIGLFWVICPTGRKKGTSYTWMCRCECDGIVEIPSGSIKRRRSCGRHCLVRKKSRSGSQRTKTDRNQIVLDLHTEGKSFAAIGREVGVSRQRVEQIVRKQEKNSVVPNEGLQGVDHQGERAVSPDNVRGIDGSDTVGSGTTPGVVGGVDGLAVGQGSEQ